MASSSQILKYPPRLYEDGKSPLQNRSMNHSCYFSQIGKIREGLGPDVWDDLMKTTLGVFIKLTDAEYTWAAQTVHYFLSNQLRVHNDHEIWCLIDQMPIRFSLYEFADVTGLNCDVIEESDTCEVAYHEFWNEMGVGTSDGPLFIELEHVMDISKAWSKEKRMMVGRLCLLSVGVHGIHHGSRIPLSSAKRVLDPVAFEKYPWGRVAFQSLLKSVKMVDLKKYTYVIHGCVHALLIWIYESVPGLAAGYGFKRETLTGTPLLDWRSSRKRIKFKDFIANEKTAHGQVRVRHMMPVTEENMYPKWSDAADNQDGLLDNLLKDIIHNRLQNDAWKHVRVQRKKRKVSRNEDGESSIIRKEKKMKESKASDDERAEVSNKNHKPRKEHMVDEEEKTRLLDIYKMLENLNGTVSEMSKNLTSRMDVLESKVESLDQQLIKRFEVVETDLKLLKESKPTVVPNDFVATSNNVELDEANSKSASWIVEEKPGSQDGLPVKRVVKKAVFTVKTKKKKAGEVSEEMFDELGEYAGTLGSDVHRTYFPIPQLDDS